MKVGICTLGCKVNTYESEFMRQELEKHGYTIAPFSSVCDVYIINTCTVTNTSDVKSRKMIEQARRRNKESCIVAVGCFIEAKKDYRSESINIYLGNQRKSEIAMILDQYFQDQKKKVLTVKEDPTQFEDMFLENFLGRCRAFVKIQDGCENYCSYCIIPYVRGKCRSKPLEKVIEEVTLLVQKGYKEVVLTGIHTGNYGVDIHTDFATLLKKLVIIPGLYRLRISSIELTELTEEVKEILKTSKVIADHLHIPLQAGSDHILSLMNRKYRIKEYQKEIEEIRKIRKDIAITTDIIVGFPGESDEDFEKTLSFARSMSFAKIHVFPFSLRTHTKAALLKDHVSSEVKKQRARALLSLSQELEREYAQKFIGKKVEVLFEQEENGISVGHTSNYLKVKVNQKIAPNTIQMVNIKGYLDSYCIAEVEEGVVCPM